MHLGDLMFRCAVLDDETRVINGTEFMRAMGIYRSGALSTRRSEDDGVYFPLHLAFKNLRPYILDDQELVDALRVPIRYRSVKGSIAEAIPAQVLRRICNVWVRARNAGVLGASQARVADKAEHLLNALADVAIIALIDEGTGYQKRRAHNELQRILSAYIAPELLPWQPRFPMSFYEQIYRVMGWRYDASSTKRTAYIGKLTNKLIYEKFPASSCAPSAHAGILGLDCRQSTIICGAPTTFWPKLRMADSWLGAGLPVRWSRSILSSTAMLKRRSRRLKRARHWRTGTNEHSC